MVPLSLLLALAATSPGSSTSHVDPTLMGRWRGSARIVVQWVQRKDLPLDLTIDGEGTVRGTVGDARLVGARLERNRGAIGRARAGQDYKTILTTYYPGTTVSRID